MAELSPALERMAGLYVELIRKGVKSIDEVPSMLRARVEEIIELDYNV